VERTTTDARHRARRSSKRSWRTSGTGAISANAWTPRATASILTCSGTSSGTARSLEALLEEPLDRGEIEARLDVSRATSHRYTQWLDQQEFVEKVDGRFRLTWRGAVVAEEVLRFEANVRTAHRLTLLFADAV